MKYTIIIVLLALVVGFCKGQGCSDAGFCTISGFNPTMKDSGGINMSNKIKAGISSGKADHSIGIFSSYVEYDRKLGAKTEAGVKLTYISQSGGAISVSGLSDVFVTGIFILTDAWKISSGVKIPLSDGNSQKDDYPLPMNYQSSLGTFDFIAGAGYEAGDIRLYTAVQYPLTQNNNKFFSDSNLVNSSLRKFNSTNNYERAGDVLFRASYIIKLTEKLKLTPGILPIYHLADDKYTDLKGVEQTIDGSSGLTFNGNLYINYKLSETGILELNGGAPFITRDSRPEGLGRSYVLTLEYRRAF